VAVQDLFGLGFYTRGDPGMNYDLQARLAEVLPDARLVQDWVGSKAVVYIRGGSVDAEETLVALRAIQDVSDAVPDTVVKLPNRKLGFWERGVTTSGQGLLGGSLATQSAAALEIVGQTLGGSLPDAPVPFRQSVEIPALEGWTSATVHVTINNVVATIVNSAYVEPTVTQNGSI